MDGKILAEIGDKEEEKVRHLLPTEDTGGIEFDRDDTKQEEVEEDENKEIDIDDI